MDDLSHAVRITTATERAPPIAGPAEVARGLSTKIFHTCPRNRIKITNSKFQIPHS